MASPIAGPSRLPFNALRTVVRQRLPTASRYASSTPGDEQPVDQRTQEAEDAYRSWIRTTGMQYESVRTGQRALWLGGSQVRQPSASPVCLLTNSHSPQTHLSALPLHYRTISRMSCMTNYALAQPSLSYHTDTMSAKLA